MRSVKFSSFAPPAETATVGNYKQSEPLKMSEKLPKLKQVTSALKGMPIMLQRVIVTVLIVVGGLIIGWVGRGVLTGPPSDSTTAVVYQIGTASQPGVIMQSWQLVCPSAKEKDRACEIGRDVIDDKSGQRIGRLAIMTEKGKKEPSLVMTVPLGVLLRPGLGFRLAGEAVKTVPYATCDAGGCSAVLPFDAKMKDAMLNAQDAAFVITTPQDRNGVDVAFSMKRFAEVYKAYKTGEAKRKHLWWRLWL